MRLRAGSYLRAFFLKWKSSSFIKHNNMHEEHRRLTWCSKDFLVKPLQLYWVQHQQPECSRPGWTGFWAIWSRAHGRGLGTTRSRLQRSLPNHSTILWFYDTSPANTQVTFFSTVLLCILKDTYRQVMWMIDPETDICWKILFSLFTFLLENKQICLTVTDTRANIGKKMHWE